MTEVFVCSVCGERFESDYPDDAAIAETRELFGIEVEREDCRVICDDCWKRMGLP